MDVEYLLTYAARQVGGIPLRELVGDAPPFENADFLFRDAGIVLELKELDEDRIEKTTVIDRMSDLYAKERAGDPAAPQIFGTVAMTTAGRSEEFKRQVIREYEKPINKLMTKANRQIRATKQALDLPSAKGVVVIANNKYGSLQPDQARLLIERQLDNNPYSSINSVVYISAGLQLELEGGPEVLDIVMEVRRTGIPAPDRTFIEGLTDAWIKVLAASRGHVDATVMPNVPQHALSRLKNRPPG